MRSGSLKEVTGKAVRGWYKWLKDNQEGCCSVWFASTDKYRYCVCVGWRKVDIDDGPGEWRTCGTMRYQAMKSHQEWRVYWKIGRQTHNNIMQTDLDIDFEMPYVTEEMAKADPKLCEGDVDDTSEEIECLTRPNHGFPYSAPRGYRSWNALAASMRKTARRVFRDWRDYDD